MINYIWELIDPNDYDITPVKNPILFNINSNKDLIVEKISLNYNILVFVI